MKDECGHLILVLELLAGLLGPGEVLLHPAQLPLVILVLKEDGEEGARVYSISRLSRTRVKFGKPNVR